MPQFWEREREREKHKNTWSNFIKSQRVYWKIVRKEVMKKYRAACDEFSFIVKASFDLNELEEIVISWKLATI